MFISGKKKEWKTEKEIKWKKDFWGRQSQGGTLLYKEEQQNEWEEGWTRKNLIVKERVQFIWKREWEKERRDESGESNKTHLGGLTEWGS